MVQDTDPETQLDPNHYPDPDPDPDLWRLGKKKKKNIDKVFNGTGNCTVSNLMGAEEQLFKVKGTVRPEWICMRVHCTIG